MNQRELEDRGETTEQLLKKRVPELEQQLAAEKARSDGLERELAHALDMGSQASVCAELAQTRADRLQKDLDERADADMANYALHAKLVAEKAARLKAEAACAEMRDALRDAQMFIEAENIDWARLNDGPDHDPNYKPEFPEIVGRLEKARSALGLGWLSPEVAEKVREAVCRCIKECDYMPAHEALAIMLDKEGAR